MQIVILAAGFGRRLQPITNTIPKCMVEVHSKPLLLNHLEKALKYKPDRIVIITGHKADYIRNAVGSSYMGVEVVYVDNPDYETTNNIYSLWLARDYFDDDTLMTECDLYHKGAPFEALVAARSDCSIDSEEGSSNPASAPVPRKRWKSGHRPPGRSPSRPGLPRASPHLSHPPAGVFSPVRRCAPSGTHLPSPAEPEPPEGFLRLSSIAARQPLWSGALAIRASRPAFAAFLSGRVGSE